MDSDVAPDARSVFVNQVTTQLVGENQVESIGKQIGYKGEIAILSATANATNQNAWIKVMKETLKKPKYKDMKLVKVAYGDDDDQKSFQETQGLIQAYPNLKGIISPTTVGVAAAARYLSSSPQKGKIKLTGLGLPEPDAQVRQGRHGRRVPALGARRTSATSPARPRPRSSRAGSPARRARSSRRGGWATTRSAPTARSSSAR